MKVASFEIGTGRVGETCPNLLLIAGPCQIESAEHCIGVARALKEACSGLPINLIFKSSFDKANRTSLTSLRGLGINAGLSALAAVRTETGLPVITDVHEASHVASVAAVVDVLQIPAFLCRQTDLLVAAGGSTKPVLIKKGQFVHPSDMRFAAEKVAACGNQKILLCERGTCFGYRDLVVDMRSLVIMRNLGFPVIFDATHSVQQMGGNNGASGGTREFVAPLLRAAIAVGVDGVFIECHPDPDHAPSDGPAMLALNQMRSLLQTLCKIRAATLSVGES